MQLSRIQVSNHARVADLDVLVRGHAVIIGANDVGKTSILRLLHLLLGATQGQLYQQLSPSDIADTTGVLSAEVTFVDFTDSDRTLYFREISVDPIDQSESMRVAISVEVDPDDDQTIAVRRWFPESGHERGPTREQQAGFGWRYLPATRGTSATSLDGPTSALRTLLNSLDLGAETNNLVSLLDTFNDQLSSNATLTDLRQLVATHLSKAMPRTLARDDLVVRTASAPAEGVLEDVSMFFDRSGTYVPLTEQSEGLRQLMSMTLFDLAEGSANVVAIDEPELHLHPSSQRTVAELFGGATNQKILATHSPYIVQRFEPSQVITVRPDGSCRQIADDKLSAVEKVLANWWSPRLLEVLTAQHAVLVEGASDRVILEKAAQLRGISLDRLGVAILEIDGAMKFPNVYKLLGPDGFDIPMFGLVDELEAPSWHGQIGGKPRDVFGKAIFVSKQDLESELCAALGGPGASSALVAAGYCREQAICQSAQVADLSGVTKEALLKFLKSRSDKVSVAVAIASQLDATSAGKIVSVDALLTAVEALGTGP